MAMRMGPMIAGALALAACAAMPAETPDPQPPQGPDEHEVWGPPAVPGEAAGPCDASAGHGFIGQRATPEIGQRLLAVTGAAELRWAPPRSALTMDYNPARLTVEYDDERVITGMTCG